MGTQGLVAACRSLEGPSATRWVGSDDETYETAGFFFQRQKVMTSRVLYPPFKGASRSPILLIWRGFLKELIL